MTDPDVLRPAGVPREDVQAGDDGMYEEAAGADEHARGPGAALGRVPRDLIPPSGPCIEPDCEGF